MDKYGEKMMEIVKYLIGDFRVSVMLVIFDKVLEFGNFLRIVDRVKFDGIYVDFGSEVVGYV